MLTVNAITKRFGVETILSDISFSLSAGQRLGLIGPNGCGKTTLLRILAGQETPDHGVAAFSPPDLAVGYLPQGFTPAPGETIAAFLTRMEGDLPALDAQLAGLAEQLAHDPDDPALQAAYDRTLADLERASAGAGRGLTVSAGLGLDQLDPATPTAHLSGGQKARLALAGVLLASPRLLLLDEPTNHLDFEMLAWLEDWLVAYPGAVLVVSHDRAFLDHVADGILELDPATHRLRAYAGNYSAYLEQRLAEVDRQWQAFSDQQDEITRLRKAAARVRSTANFRKGGKGDSGDKFAAGFFANRSLGTMRRAHALEARLEKLLGEDRIEKPKASWQMKLEFDPHEAGGREMAFLEELAVGYPGASEQDPPFELASGIHASIQRGARIALVGPNGAGKTTLLRTIAGQLEPLAGRVRLSPSARLGYMAQGQENLPPDQNAFTIISKLAPFSETEARAFLHYYLFSGDAVFTPVGALSYGERARLALACLAAQGCNLLLLDEPINHLDIPSRARFEQALSGFEGAVVCVAHDRFFIASFAEHIWEVRSGGFQNLHNLT